MIHRLPGRSARPETPRRASEPLRIPVADQPISLLAPFAAVCYGVAVLLCEVLIVVADARWGLVGYALVFLATTAAAVGNAAQNSPAEPVTSTGPRAERRAPSAEAAFFTALAAPPVLRLFDIAAPVESLELPLLHGLLAAPALLTVGLAIRAAGFSARTLGFAPGRSWRGAAGDALALAAGAGAGYLAYRQLQPGLPSGWDTPVALATAFPLMAAAALAEELLFRGVLLPATGRLFGPQFAVAYVTVLFTLFHVGYRSLPMLLVVGALGGLFALVVLRTRSLYGVTLGHAAFSFGLWLGFPWLFQN